MRLTPEEEQELMLAISEFQAQGATNANVQHIAAKTVNEILERRPISRFEEENRILWLGITHAQGWAGNGEMPEWFNEGILNLGKAT